MFKNSGDSSEEDEGANEDMEKDESLLPAIGKKMVPQLSSNEFLKLYKQKNAMHEPDREKALSIANNLEYNAKIAKENPFFNKKKGAEKLLKISTQHLFALGQIPEDNESPK